MWVEVGRGSCDGWLVMFDGLLVRCDGWLVGVMGGSYFIFISFHFFISFIKH